MRLTAAQALIRFLASQYVERLRLHVLRERERDRARLRLVHEHAHRVQRRGNDLLRSPDPVEVAGDRPQALVHRDVAGPRHLELLQHGIGPARREDVARQQQHGQAVHRRGRRAGDHVRRARADRRGADERPEPVLHPRVADGGMHHPLFVPPLVIGEEVAVLVQRLPDAGDVAVPEDAEAAGEEPLPRAVSLRPLVDEELDDRLPDRQPYGGH